MTIAEAIAMLNKLKPNVFDDNTKIEWLNQIDTQIKQEVLDCHQHSIVTTALPYNSTTATTTELLVSSPHTMLYEYWLEAQVDYHNGEINRFNNSIQMFNSAYSNYVNWFNRTHNYKPKRELNYYRNLDTAETPVNAYDVTIGTLSVTANGTYSAGAGKAYSSVTVAVPEQIATKTTVPTEKVTDIVIVNGTYYLWRA